MGTWRCPLTNWKLLILFIHISNENHGKSNCSNTPLTATKSWNRQTMQHKAIKLMASMMAKELTLGIKDSVEDVSAMFKRMAPLKPQASAWSIFSEQPQERGETSVLSGGTAEPAVKFTFGSSAAVPAVNPVPRPEPFISPVINKPAAGKISEQVLGQSGRGGTGFGDFGGLRNGCGGRQNRDHFRRA